MWFIVLGVVIIGLNLANIGPFGHWTWEITGDLWKFCVPFVLALLWWIWADKSGLDKRREIEKMDARRAARREENLTALGLGGREKRKGGKR